jgi:hypothetical protein
LHHSCWQHVGTSSHHTPQLRVGSDLPRQHHTATASGKQSNPSSTPCGGATASHQPSNDWPHCKAWLGS